MIKQFSFEKISSDANAPHKIVGSAIININEVKTFVTDVAICLLFVARQFIASQFGVIVYFIGYALFIISVILTLYSGVYYIVKNKDVFKA